MTHVLIIGYVWPEPNSSAAGSRMVELLQLFLDQRWSVTFASPAADSEYMCDIEAMGVKKLTIELNNSSFDEMARELNPDIILYDRFMMEEQFGWRIEKSCPNALRVLDTVDLHCLRHSRQLGLKDNTSWTSHLFSEMAHREVASILRCDLTLVTSWFEINLLTETFHTDQSLLHHLPFMLEPIKSLPGPGFTERQHFISIGNFRHEPNWDAVRHLKETIWPMIRHELPDTALHVYGAYPPAKATQLHNPRQGFHVFGRADDVDSVMKNARICLAPLRFGAGIKGKLTDAMRCGTPSITTDIGSESMHDDLPWSGAIENDPDDFARAAVDVYRDEAKWEECRKHGVEIINACYDKITLGQNVITRLDSIRNTLSAHRLNNFTGSMLRHHTMKSTQYMSRWIETKNKLSNQES